MRPLERQAKCKGFVLACLLLFVGIKGFGAQPRYTVEPIDTSAAGPYVWLADANKFGAIVGTYGSTSVWQYSSHEAMFYTPTGGLELLGNLGGTNSYAYFVNSSGQVAGESQVNDQYYTHGFLWSRQTGMLDIGTLGGAKTTVRSLNESGQVVGSSDSAITPIWADPDRAFRYTPGIGMKDLGTLGGASSAAFGINSQGWVTGVSLDQDGDGHAFRYRDDIGMEDLGGFSPSDSPTIGYAINDYGIVVGLAACDINVDEAILATGNRSPIGLGHLLGDCTFSSGALAINNRNVAIGYSFVYVASDLGVIEAEHAFVWTRERGMEDLNDLISGSSWEISQAFKISDEGRILARAQRSDGPIYDVFLNPILPRLRMELSRTNAVVSWAPDSTEYVLEQADTLGSTNWAAVPDVTGSSVTISINHSTHFYRLRRFTNDEVQEQFNRWLSP